MGWFNGMQYPYGDQLAFADGQPGITIPLVILKKIGIDFNGYELGLVQCLPILGLWVGFFIFDKIVKRLNIPLGWSLITVIACIALSPQLYRFNAHFTLGYVFCFPLIWYLIIKVEAQEFSRIGFIIFASMINLYFGFIHPYHLLINTLFLASYFCIKLIRKQFKWEFILAAMLPIIGYLIINGLIDPYNDRPLNPWGAWHYKAEISDLIPFYGWFKNSVGSLFPLRDSYHEGYSYLGVLIFLSPMLLIRKRETVYKKTTVHITDQFLAALLLLAFAMGLHILLTNHKVLDWVSTLKQFRALGRFSWPFYYTGFVALSYIFYRRVEAFKSKLIIISALGFICFFWILDAFSYHKSFRDNFNKYKAPNELVENTELLNILDKKKIDQSNFQAILPIPVSMEGSEKFTPSDHWFTKTRTIPLAFQTGLPIIGAYMSRTSLSRILKQYQLCSSTYIEKEILNELPNKKDLLVCIAKEDSTFYNDIISKSTFIGDTKETILLQLSLDSLKYKMLNDSFMIRSSQGIMYNDFDNNKGLLSKGVLEVRGEQVLADTTITPNTQRLIFSCWIRIDQDQSTVPFFNISIFDNDEKVIKEDKYRDWNIKRAEIFQNWVQIKREIEIPENSSKVIWKVNADYIAIDHVLITANNQVFKKQLDDSYVIYDHYIAKLKDK